MQNSKQCLIITATIQPNSNFVAKSSAEERRREYLNVLKYYSEMFSGDILFVENSAYNFKDDTEFNEIFELNNVQLIEFPKSLEIDKGKGYQEFEVLDFVVAQIEHKYIEFIKVSGRYLTVNFKKLIQQKSHGIIIDRHKKKNVAITSFFRCNVDSYLRNLKNCYQEVNDSNGVFVEHVVYNKLKGVNNQNMDIFPTTPIYKGVSGSYGGDLNRHPFKTKVRNIERKLLRLLNLKEFLIEY